MIGVSGSGKSTYAEMLCKNLNSTDKTTRKETTIISSDAIRAELCNGDVSDQSKNSQVFEVAYKRIEQTLQLGVNVIWDATNLSREERVKPIAIGRKYGAELIAIQINTPLTIAMERNNRRERKVPVNIIWRQHGRFFPATKKEFDKIGIVGISGITFL